MVLLMKKHFVKYCMVSSMPYGLPKQVHKSGCPFRPIVSSVDTYNTYHLASYRVRVLQPISTNQFTVKDSFSFAERITLRPIVLEYFNLSQLTSLLSRTPSAEWAKTYNLNGDYMCYFDQR